MYNSIKTQLQSTLHRSNIRQRIKRDKSKDWTANACFHITNAMQYSRKSCEFNSTTIVINAALLSDISVLILR